MKTYFRNYLSEKAFDMVSKSIASAAWTSTTSLVLYKIKLDDLNGIRHESK